MTQDDINKLKTLKSKNGLTEYVISTITDLPTLVEYFDNILNLAVIEAKEEALNIGVICGRANSRKGAETARDYLENLKKQKQALTGEGE